MPKAWQSYQRPKAWCSCQRYGDYAKGTESMSNLRRTCKRDIDEWWCWRHGSTHRVARCFHFFCLESLQEFIWVGFERGRGWSWLEKILLINHLLWIIVNWRLRELKPAPTRWPYTCTICTTNCNSHTRWLPSSATPTCHNISLFCSFFLGTYKHVKNTGQ